MIQLQERIRQLWTRLAGQEREITFNIPQLGLLLEAAAQHDRQLIRKVGRHVYPDNPKGFVVALEAGGLGPAHHFVPDAIYKTPQERWEKREQHDPRPAHDQPGGFSDSQVRLPASLANKLAQTLQEYRPEKLGGLPVPALELLDLSSEQLARLLAQTSNLSKRQRLLRVAGKEEHGQTRRQKL